MLKDREAWCAEVYRATKIWTWLSNSNKNYSQIQRSREVYANNKNAELEKYGDFIFFQI